MVKKTNADIEKHYFEQFRLDYKLPSGRIDYADKPDVLLIGEKTVGIEITRFHRQSGKDIDSEQRQGPLRKGLVSDAQKLYLEGGGRKIELTFNFDTKHPITGDRSKTLPRELADLTSKIESQASGQVERDLFQPTMPELSSIYLNATEYANPLWRITQLHKVELMSGAALEEIVRDKETKSGQYVKCDTYWLLVVVDWADPAQEQEIRVDGVKISSRIFEKIIVYKPKFEHIVEVQR